jgi:hypothetical protein
MRKASEVGDRGAGRDGAASARLRSFNVSLASFACGAVAYRAARVPLSLQSLIPEYNFLLDPHQCALQAKVLSTPKLRSRLVQAGLVRACVPLSRHRPAACIVTVVRLVMPVRWCAVRQLHKEESTGVLLVVTRPRLDLRSPRKRVAVARDAAQSEVCMCACVAFLELEVPTSCCRRRQVLSGLRVSPPCMQKADEQQAVGGEAPTVRASSRCDGSDTVDVALQLPSCMSCRSHH